ncbi:hypothetical protein BpHYR1_005255 [Brachionus plicatilis]|uniref:Cystatin domain-containing protein n=1 Tax=Brachionus plicatilis TaxID=10195 RepID=A0A3M7Q0Y2_BRAPC|nr:hypothetical protein BpHYR1_005255 [Brachionus plicatilis]
MFKFVAICLSLLVAVQALSLAKFATTEDVQDLARWAAPKMAPYTQIQGQYTVLTVRNLQVKNNNYRFTLDLLVQDLDYKYLFRSCDLSINYQSSTNAKEIVGTPKCGPHPNYQ